MNVWTDRQKDRQTDEPHELHVYVGLAQARPNYIYIAIATKLTTIEYIIVVSYIMYCFISR